MGHIHCVKSVRIRSYSGPYFPEFGLSTDQNNSEYRHFLCSDNLSVQSMFTLITSASLKYIIKLKKSPGKNCLGYLGYTYDLNLETFCYKAIYIRSYKNFIKDEIIHFKRFLYKPLAQQHLFNMFLHFRLILSCIMLKNHQT